MAAKVDSSSTSVSASSTVSASSPKVSIFATKAGFVIPKNKLAGSLVPRYRGAGKNDAGISQKEESAKQVQRKTKWGPDLTADPAVRKARALAYQTRLEQITKLLKPGALEIGENESLLSPTKDSNPDFAADQIKKESQKLELLELERREIIGEIICLNASYKAPADYKPLLKEARVPIPIKAYPGCNFIGLLLGPESNAQKRLQDETGAKVRIYGIKKETGEKHEITQADMKEAQDAYDDQYVEVSADTYEKVDAAVALIELLLTPVTVSSAAASTTSSAPLTVPLATANQGITQPAPLTVPPGLPLYQPYPAPWLMGALPNTSSIPPGLIPRLLPNSSFQFQPSVGPLFTPPHNGQPSPIGLMPRSSSVAPSHLLPAQSMLQPLNHGIPPQGFLLRGQQHVIVPAPRPIVPMNPQPMPTAALGSLPSRPLLSSPGSSGWTTLPPAGISLQRPAQMVFPSIPSPFRPPVTVTPATIIPPVSVLNVPSNILGGPPTANTSVPTQPNLSRPATPTAAFPSMPPPTGTPSHASMPTPKPIRPPVASSTMPTLQATPPTSIRGPLPIPHTGPILAAPAPVLPQAPTQSAGPVPTQSPVSVPPSAAAPRPPRPISGDFTFRPIRAQISNPNLPRPASQVEAQGALPLAAPQAPSFRPATQNASQPVGTHGFQRPPVDANQMGLPRMPVPPLLSSLVPFPGNLAVGQPPPRIPAFSGPNPVRPMTPTAPMGFSGFSSAQGQVNLPSITPVQPVQFFRAQQPGSRPPGQVAAKVPPSPGGNQIYDPFSPTSISVTPAKQSGDASAVRKPEADPEYEDLMASVGVK